MTIASTAARNLYARILMLAVQPNAAPEPRGQQHRNKQEAPNALAPGACSALASQILRTQPSPASDPCQHPRSNFLALVEGKDEIWPTGACQNAMRAGAVPLDLPADPKQRGQNQPGFPGSPLAHAATEKTSTNSGTDSPCSNRSASTRRARALTRATASSRVVPYTMTPGKSGISLSQRPSSSRSISMRIRMLQDTRPWSSVSNLNSRTTCVSGGEWPRLTPALSKAATATLHPLHVMVRHCAAHD